MRRGQGNAGRGHGGDGRGTREGGAGSRRGHGPVRLGQSSWRPRARPIGWWRDRAAEAGCVELPLPSLPYGQGK